MTLQQHSPMARILYATVFGTILVACGGSPVEQSNMTLATMQSSAAMSVSSRGTTSYVPQSRGTASSGNTGANAAVTDLRFASTSTTTQTNVPVTFGQVFSPGHLSADAGLVGRLDSGATVPLQLDIKAKHADGSVRHAVVSAILPSLGAGEVRTMSLIRSTAGAATAAVSPSALVDAGFTASFSATIDGKRYTASADQLLKSGKATSWLAGAQANEWLVSAPLVTEGGVQHPHLAARFAIRWYQAAKKARVDVAVENNWAYETGPRNFTYDASFLVGGEVVYAKPGLTHLHHARWRKLGWWNGTAPDVDIKLNSGYLIGTRAVANYDQTLSIPESALKALKTEWTGPKTEPMGAGLANPYMPSTGGRRDIGLLPGWAVTYLLSMDERARDVTFSMADLAGSWSSHYRDKQTGYPVSLIDYPYMTIYGNAPDTYNAAKKRYESFPVCAGAGLCDTKNVHDNAHQPNFAYLPYLVTGDYYYLEELQFWGMWSAFSSNPHHRGFEKGLMYSHQVRAQGWSLRAVAEAAYISPDGHPLKAHFASILDANLDWYNTTYANGGSTSNALGVITNGYAMAYDNATALAPWQDDFFTSSIGHIAELGFSKASTLLKYKIKFPIDRMIGTGACWVGASEYTMKVRDTSTSPFYSTIGQVFKATNPLYASLACGSSTLAAALGLKVGEMSGYPSSLVGYPANMQPALAYAADAGGADGTKAWALFEQRSSKPTYELSPQFAIRPR